MTLVRITLDSPDPNEGLASHLAGERARSRGLIEMLSHVWPDEPASSSHLAKVN
jgi:hypothetical protein